MPGGLLQLASQGYQDVFLTDDPEITFYKKVYRKYTNFAIEDKEIKISDTIDFGKQITCIIPKHGDLLGNCTLKIKLPKLENKIKTIKIDENITVLNYDDFYKKNKIEIIDNFINFNFDDVLGLNNKVMITLKNILNDYNINYKKLKLIIKNPDDNNYIYNLSELVETNDSNLILEKKVLKENNNFYYDLLKIIANDIDHPFLVFIENNLKSIYDNYILNSKIIIDKIVSNLEEQIFFNQNFQEDYDYSIFINNQKTNEIKIYNEIINNNIPYKFISDIEIAYNNIATKKKLYKLNNVLEDVLIYNIYIIKSLFDFYYNINKTYLILFSKTFINEKSTRFNISDSQYKNVLSNIFNVIINDKEINFKSKDLPIIDYIKNYFFNTVNIINKNLDNIIINNKEILFNLLSTLTSYINANNSNIINKDGKLTIEGRINNKFIFKPNKKDQTKWDLIKKYFLFNKGFVNVKIDNTIVKYEYKFTNNTFKIQTLEKKNIDIELLIINIFDKNQIINQNINKKLNLSYIYLDFNFYLYKNIKSYIKSNFEFKEAHGTEYTNTSLLLREYLYDYFNTQMNIESDNNNVMSNSPELIYLFDNKSFKKNFLYNEYLSLISSNIIKVKFDTNTFFNINNVIDNFYSIITKEEINLLELEKDKKIIIKIEKNVDHFNIYIDSNDYILNINTIIQYNINININNKIYDANITYNISLNRYIITILDNDIPTTNYTNLDLIIFYKYSLQLKESFYKINLKGAIHKTATNIIEINLENEQSKIFMNKFKINEYIIFKISKTKFDAKIKNITINSIELETFNDASKNFDNFDNIIELVKILKKDEFILDQNSNSYIFNLPCNNQSKYTNLSVFINNFEGIEYDFLYFSDTNTKNNIINFINYFRKIYNDYEYNNIIISLEENKDLFNSFNLGNKIKHNVGLTSFKFYNSIKNKLRSKNSFIKTKYLSGYLSINIEETKILGAHIIFNAIDTNLDYELTIDEIIIISFKDNDTEYEYKFKIITIDYNKNILNCLNINYETKKTITDMLENQTFLLYRKDKPYTQLSGYYRIDTINGNDIIINNNSLELNIDNKYINGLNFIIYDMNYDLEIGDIISIVDINNNKSFRIIIDINIDTRKVELNYDVIYLYNINEIKISKEFNALYPYKNLKNIKLFKSNEIRFYPSNEIKITSNTISFLLNKTIFKINLNDNPFYIKFIYGTQFLIKIDENTNYYNINSTDIIFTITNLYKDENNLLIIESISNIESISINYVTLYSFENILNQVGQNDVIRMESRTVTMFRSIKEKIINSNILIIDDTEIDINENIEFNLLQNSFIPNNYLKNSNIIITNNNLIVNNFLKEYQENNIILKNNIKNNNLFKFIKISILSYDLDQLFHINFINSSNDLSSNEITTHITKISKNINDRLSYFNKNKNIIKIKNLKLDKKHYFSSIIKINDYIKSLIRIDQKNDKYSSYIQQLKLNKNVINNNNFKINYLYKKNEFKIELKYFKNINSNKTIFSLEDIRQVEAINYFDKDDYIIETTNYTIGKIVNKNQNFIEIDFLTDVFILNNICNIEHYTFNIVDTSIIDFNNVEIVLYDNKIKDTIKLNNTIKTDVNYSKDIIKKSIFIDIIEIIKNIDNETSGYYINNNSIIITSLKKKKSNIGISNGSTFKLLDNNSLYKYSEDELVEIGFINDEESFSEYEIIKIDSDTIYFNSLISGDTIRTQNLNIFTKNINYNEIDTLTFLDPFNYEYKNIQIEIINTPKYKYLDTQLINPDYYYNNLFLNRNLPIKLKNSIISEANIYFYKNENLYLNKKLEDYSIYDKIVTKIKIGKIQSYTDSYIIVNSEYDFLIPNGKSITLENNNNINKNNNNKLNLSVINSTKYINLNNTFDYTILYESNINTVYLNNDYDVYLNTYENITLKEQIYTFKNIYQYDETNGINMIDIINIKSDNEINNYLTENSILELKYFNQELENVKYVSLYDNNLTLNINTELNLDKNENTVIILETTSDDKTKIYHKLSYLQSEKENEYIFLYQNIKYNIFLIKFNHVLSNTIQFQSEINKESNEILIMEILIDNNIDLIDIIIKSKINSQLYNIKHTIDPNKINKKNYYTLSSNNLNNFQNFQNNDNNIQIILKNEINKTIGIFYKENNTIYSNNYNKPILKSFYFIINPIYTVDIPIDKFVYIKQTSLINVYDGSIINKNNKFKIYYSDNILNYRRIFYNNNIGAFKIEYPDINIEDNMFFMINKAINNDNDDKVIDNFSIFDDKTIKFPINKFNIISKYLSINNVLEIKSNTTSDSTQYIIDDIIVTKSHIYIGLDDKIKIKNINKSIKVLYFYSYYMIEKEFNVKANKLPTNKYINLFQNINNTDDLIIVKELISFKKKIIYKPVNKFNFLANLSLDKNYELLIKYNKLNKLSDYYKLKKITNNVFILDGDTKDIPQFYDNGEILTINYYDNQIAFSFIGILFFSTDGGFYILYKEGDYNNKDIFEAKFFKVAIDKENLNGDIKIIKYYLSPYANRYIIYGYKCEFIDFLNIGDIIQIDIIIGKIIFIFNNNLILIEGNNINLEYLNKIIFNSLKKIRIITNLDVDLSTDTNQNVDLSTDTNQNVHVAKLTRLFNIDFIQQNDLYQYGRIEYVIMINNKIDFDFTFIFYYNDDLLLNPDLESYLNGTTKCYIKNLNVSDKQFEIHIEKNININLIENYNKLNIYTSNFYSDKEYNLEIYKWYTNKNEIYYLCKLDTDLEINNNNKYFLTNTNQKINSISKINKLFPINSKLNTIKKLNNNTIKLIYDNITDRSIIDTKLNYSLIIKNNFLTFDYKIQNIISTDSEFSFVFDINQIYFGKIIESTDKIIKFQIENNPFIIFNNSGFKVLLWENKNSNNKVEGIIKNINSDELEIIVLNNHYNIDIDTLNSLELYNSKLCDNLLNSLNLIKYSGINDSIELSDSNKIFFSYIDINSIIFLDNNTNDYINVILLCNPYNLRNINYSINNVIFSYKDINIFGTITADSISSYSVKVKLLKNDIDNKTKQIILNNISNWYQIKFNYEENLEIINMNENNINYSYNKISNFIEVNDSNNITDYEGNDVTIILKKNVKTDNSFFLSTNNMFLIKTNNKLLNKFILIERTSYDIIKSSAKLEPIDNDNIYYYQDNTSIDKILNINSIDTYKSTDELNTIIENKYLLFLKYYNVFDLIRKKIDFKSILVKYNIDSLYNTEKKIFNPLFIKKKININATRIEFELEDSDINMKKLISYIYKLKKIFIYYYDYYFNPEIDIIFQNKNEKNSKYLVYIKSNNYSFSGNVINNGFITNKKNNFIKEQKVILSKDNDINSFQIITIKEIHNNEVLFNRNINKNFNRINILEYGILLYLIHNKQLLFNIGIQYDSFNYIPIYYNKKNIYMMNESNINKNEQILFNIFKNSNYHKNIEMNNDKRLLETLLMENIVSLLIKDGDFNQHINNRIIGISKLEKLNYRYEYKYDMILSKEELSTIESNDKNYFSDSINTKIENPIFNVISIDNHITNISLYDNLNDLFLKKNIIKSMITKYKINFFGFINLNGITQFKEVPNKIIETLNNISFYSNFNVIGDNYKINNIDYNKKDIFITSRFFMGKIQNFNNYIVTDEANYVILSNYIHNNIIGINSILYFEDIETNQIIENKIKDINITVNKIVIILDKNITKIASNNFNNQLTINNVYRMYLNTEYEYTFYVYNRINNINRMESKFNYPIYEIELNDTIKLNDNQIYSSIDSCLSINNIKISTLFDNYTEFEIEIETNDLNSDQMYVLEQLPYTSKIFGTITNNIFTSKNDIKYEINSNNISYINNIKVKYSIDDSKNILIKDNITSLGYNKDFIILNYEKITYFINKISKVLDFKYVLKIKNSKITNEIINGTKFLLSWTDLKSNSIIPYNYKLINKSKNIKKNYFSEIYGYIVDNKFYFINNKSISVNIYLYSEQAQQYYFVIKNDNKFNAVKFAILSTNIIYLKSDSDNDYKKYEIVFDKITNLFTIKNTILNVSENYKLKIITEDIVIDKDSVYKIGNNYKNSSYIKINKITNDYYCFDGIVNKASNKFFVLNWYLVDNANIKYKYFKDMYNDFFKLKDNLIYSSFENNIDYINKNLISFIKYISLSDISKLINNNVFRQSLNNITNKYLNLEEEASELLQDYSVFNSNNYLEYIYYNFSLSNCKLDNISILDPEDIINRNNKEMMANYYLLDLTDNNIIIDNINIIYFFGIIYTNKFEAIQFDEANPFIIDKSLLNRQSSNPYIVIIKLENYLIDTSYNNYIKINNNLIKPKFLLLTNKNIKIKYQVDFFNENNMKRNDQNEFLINYKFDNYFSKQSKIINDYKNNKRAEFYLDRLVPVLNYININSIIKYKKEDIEFYGNLIKFSSFRNSKIILKDYQEINYDNHVVQVYENLYNTETNNSMINIIIKKELLNNIDNLNITSNIFVNIIKNSEKIITVTANDNINSEINDYKIIIIDYQINFNKITHEIYFVVDFDLNNVYLNNYNSDNASANIIGLNKLTVENQNMFIMKENDYDIKPNQAIYKIKINNQNIFDNIKKNDYIILQFANNNDYCRKIEDFNDNHISFNQSIPYFDNISKLIIIYGKVDNFYKGNVDINLSNLICKNINFNYIFSNKKIFFNYKNQDIQIKNINKNYYNTGLIGYSLDLNAFAIINDNYIESLYFDGNIINYDNQSYFVPSSNQQENFNINSKNPHKIIGKINNNIFEPDLKEYNGNWLILINNYNYKYKKVLVVLDKLKKKLTTLLIIIDYY